MSAQRSQWAPKRNLRFWSATTMPGPSLPAETLDSIIDLLHDAEDALKSCCLVSKSWVPRTRKYLFFHVALSSPAKLRSWKTTFPDPSISPARYTRSLFIKFPRTIIPEDAEEGGWIPTFSRVVRLAMGIDGIGAYESLVLFHGFSPVIRSLRLTSTSVAPSYTLNFIRSFPLLEDISVIAWFVDTNLTTTDDQPTSLQLSKPPALTGSLELSFVMGMDLIASRLLSLQNGPHFRQLNLVWSSDEDISSTAALVERCFHTLECLHVSFGPIGKSFRLSALQWLTTSCSQAGAQVNRPLESHKTQRSGISMRVESPMDHYNAPNHLTRSQKPPTNLTQRVSRASCCKF